MRPGLRDPEECQATQGQPHEGTEEVKELRKLEDEVMTRKVPQW